MVRPPMPQSDMLFVANLPIRSFYFAQGKPYVGMLSHMAMQMATDLRLDKSPEVAHAEAISVKAAPARGLVNLSVKNDVLAYPNFVPYGTMVGNPYSEGAKPHTHEERRTLLGCYIVSTMQVCRRENI
jgi:hypothetical protein